MGSSETIVASRVVLPEPPLTRLPSLTFLSEMRPVIGARTSVHSKFSCGGLLCRLGDLQLRLGDGKAGGALVVVAAGYGVRSNQWLGALYIGGRHFDLCPGAGNLGLGAVEGDGKRTLVDREQRVAGLDHGAVDEIHFVDEARYARAHLHRFHGDEAA